MSVYIRFGTAVVFAGAFCTSAGLRPGRAGRRAGWPSEAGEGRATERDHHVFPTGIQRSLAALGNDNAAGRPSGFFVLRLSCIPPAPRRTRPHARAPTHAPPPRSSCPLAAPQRAGVDAARRDSRCVRFGDACRSRPSGCWGHSEALFSV